MLHVDRIDHGNRALEDDGPGRAAGAERHDPDGVPALEPRALRRRDLADHPLKRMLELGLLVTVNSDDPAYFGGYLVQNWMAPRRRSSTRAARIRHAGEERGRR